MRTLFTACLLWSFLAVSAAGQTTPPTVSQSCAEISITSAEVDARIRTLQETEALLRKEQVSIDPGTLEASELEVLMQRIEQCVHLPARYLTAIVDFHLAVTEMAHNAVFTLALQAMRNTLIQELNRLISDQSLRTTIILELKNIWKAISDHDAFQAGQLMRLHLSHLDQQLSGEL